MSQVACVFGAAVTEAGAWGLPAEKLVEGLGLDPAVLSDPRKRIPWDTFAEMARRTEELLGPDGLEDLAARSAELAIPRLLRPVLAKLGDARPAYLMGARWWGPWVFRSTRATCEKLADGRLREVIEILPGFRECPEFFRGVRGLLRATPRLFGQPEAVVDLETNGRRGEFIISPPPARHRFGRRKRTALRALPKELGFHQEQLRESEHRANAAAALLAESSVRLSALEDLGEQLTRSRSVQGRVAAVIRLIEGRLLVRGVRLSHVGARDAEDRLDLCAESGEITGRPSATLALEVAGRLIGQIELWVLGDGELSSDDEALLHDLVPWIALALEDARTADQIRRLTRLLEDEIEDWHFVQTALDRAMPGYLPSDAERARGGGDAANTSGPEAVLLVEDDPELRAIGRRKLEAAGHAVFETESDPFGLPPGDPVFPIHLVVADLASAALTPAFLRAVRLAHPELRGVLLVPLHEPGTVPRST